MSKNQIKTKEKDTFYWKADDKIELTGAEFHALTQINDYLQPFMTYGVLINSVMQRLQKEGVLTKEAPRVSDGELTEQLKEEIARSDPRKDPDKEEASNILDEISG